jgi:signal peptidase I
MISKTQKPTYMASILRVVTKAKDSAAFVILALVALRTFIIDWSIVPSGSMSHTLLTGDVVMYWKGIYGHLGSHSIPVIGHRFIEGRVRRVFIKECRMKRADIAVFAMHRAYLTKRVVGLPPRTVNGAQVDGDLIEWNGSDLRINGRSTIYKPDGTTIGDPPRDYILKKQHSGHPRDIVMKEYDCFIPTDDGKFVKIKVLYEAESPEVPWCRYRVPAGYIFVVGDNRPPMNSFDSRESSFGDVPIASVNGRLCFRLFGSNGHVFDRSKKRNLVQTLLMFPVSVIKYIFGLNLGRFAPLRKDIVELPEMNYVSPVPGTISSGFEQPAAVTSQS